MDSILVKITKRKYAEDIQHGLLYMNSLDYFRNLEGNDAQGDLMEGSSMILGHDKINDYGFDFDKKTIDLMLGPMILLNEGYKNVNLFCLYQLAVDYEHRRIQKPSQDLMKFQDDDELHAVVITDNNEFIKRIELAISDLFKNCRINYSIYGDVHYNIDLSKDNDTYTTSFFNKLKFYSFQQEWRIALSLIGKEADYFILDIGNIEDITKIVSIKDFLNCSWLKDYEVFDGLTYEQSNCYKVMKESSSIPEMVSNNFPNEVLLDGYDIEFIDEITIIENIIFDNGFDSASRYVTKRAIEENNIAYLELLSIILIRHNNLIAAAEIYSGMLEKNDDFVKKNAKRFFLNYIEIVLSFNNELHAVIDAAKLLIIAVDGYEVPLIELKWQSFVILSYLRFNIEAIEILDELLGSEEKLKYLYSKVVCYFYLLDFDNALLIIEHIKDKYKPNSFIRDGINIISSLISSIKCAVPLTNNNNNTCSAYIIDKISNLKDKSMFLDFDSFNHIFSNNGLPLLNIPSKVFMSSQAVSRIVDSCLTNEECRRLANYLSNQKNLCIISPKIYSLIKTNDTENSNDLIYLAEQAIIKSF